MKRNEVLVIGKMGEVMVVCGYPWSIMYRQNKSC